MRKLLFLGVIAAGILCGCATTDHGKVVSEVAVKKKTWKDVWGNEESGTIYLRTYADGSTVEFIK